MDDQPDQKTLVQKLSSLLFGPAKDALAPLEPVAPPPRGLETLSNVLSASVFKNFIQPVTDRMGRVHDTVSHGERFDTPEKRADGVMTGFDVLSPGAARAAQLAARTGVDASVHAVGGKMTPALQRVEMQIADIDSAIRNAQAKGYQQSIPELQKQRSRLVSQRMEARRAARYEQD